LINSRRATFTAIGLDVRKADPLDVSAYKTAIEEANS
jgi:hypothetical protein